ncbi:hypothetical protein MMC07_005007 [Pseudocyphellaria aurata]|nr:hypothetical protein [Pseudocyphellaria aurata]
MSRPNVVPAILSRRERLRAALATAPPPKSTELDPDFSKRIQARLAQRAAAKAAEAAAANLAAARTAANVAAGKRQEVPWVPRRWQRPTLESKESSHKAIRQPVPARSDKSSAVQSAKPRDGPVGRPLAPRRPTDFLVIQPMAPRATRFRAVDDAPLAASPPPTPKVALKGILRGGDSRKNRQEKKVSFSHVETKEVEKWIGVEQGIESRNQLFSEEGTRCHGKWIHIHPDPCRIVAGKLVGWDRLGDDDNWNYRLGDRRVKGPIAR